MSLNVGESCLYLFTGSEYTCPFPPHGPTAGVARGATVIAVNPGSPTTYDVRVWYKPTIDGSQPPEPMYFDNVEYAATPTQGKVCPANWAQVPAGAIATAISAAATAASSAQSDATTAVNAAASNATALGKLSQARVQNTTANVGVTAGAAATVLETSPDYALDAGKSLLVDVSLSVVCASLLTTATVTVAVDRSDNAGSSWTNVATKSYALTGAALNVIPSRGDPAFACLATRASAGNSRVRLTVACTGADVTVTERGISVRWAQTPN